MLFAISPDMLVYDRIDRFFVSSLAAYPRGGEKPSSALGETHPFDRPQSFIPFHSANYSSASLEGVVRARTFLRQNDDCRAIVLEYSNGSQRAMGDCRLGIDPVEIWNMPKCICVFKTTHTLPPSAAALQGVKIRFSEREHQHAEPGWTCHAMRGNIEFWHNLVEICISILR